MTPDFPDDEETTDAEPIVMDEAAAGERLDRALAMALPELSRSRLKGLIEQGAVSFDGATIREPSHRVKPGEEYLLSLPDALPAEPAPQDIPLSVVYEDEWLIVVDKPVGMVVHPAPGNLDGTLVNALLFHCGASLVGIGGVARPGIVHRIDKDTSGLLVVAKTEPAHVALSSQFAKHSIERAYQAIVWGGPNPSAGTIEGDIGRSPADRKKMAVVRHGKRAVTHYQVLRRFGHSPTSPLDPIASLVECRLETGRTHQIRVHLTDKGHPLLGDATYSRSRRRSGLPEAITEFPRQALHAAVLGFVHPATREPMNFSSPTPPDMAELITALEALP